MDAMSTKRKAKMIEAWNRWLRASTPEERRAAWVAFRTLQDRFAAAAAAAPKAKGTP